MGTSFLRTKAGCTTFVGRVDSGRLAGFIRYDGLVDSPHMSNDAIGPTLTQLPAEHWGGLGGKLGELRRPRLGKFG